MTKRKILPSSMDTPWADSNSYNLSELNTIQDGVASPCLSSSLPFCVRFNRALQLASQPYNQAATLDTKPLAKSYLGGSPSHLSSTHFQYARPTLCSSALKSTVSSLHANELLQQRRVRPRHVRLRPVTDDAPVLGLRGRQQEY